jgi:hypothetical protein
MTSPPLPPSGHDADGPVDETDALLSAVLDGVATADERARVEDDPALRGRLEALRSLQGQLRTPVEPLPPDRVDAMVLAALDAAGATAGRPNHPGTPADGDVGPIPDPDPVPLPSRSRHRRHGRRPWLVAAAVAAFVALGTLAVPGALDRLAPRDEDASTAAGPLQDAGEAGDSGGEGATAEAPTTTAAGDPTGPPASGAEGPDLGIAGSVDELVARAEQTPFDAAVRDGTTGADATESIGPPASPQDQCPELVTPDEADRASVATGVVDGETLLVVLLAPTDGWAGTVRVVRSIDCVVVLERAR